MVQGNATLIVDFGNSSTKGTVLFGKDAKTGRFREKSFDIPNVFAPISEDYVVSADYSTETSSIIKVNSMINGQNVVGSYCNGEVQRKERAVTTIKPTATIKKFDAPATVLSCHLAFLHAAKVIMRMQNVTDFAQLDINWKVVTLLPPGDLEVGAEKMVDLISKTTEVDSTYPAAKFPVKVDMVQVLPEGYCAYIGTVYDKGQTFRPENRFLTEETVIVFDIGAGTTDCLIIENNKLVQNSKHTITQGGNNVFQLVKRKLQLAGLELTDEAIRNGVVKGSVKDGAKVIDITGYVNEAKAEVAQKIISAFYDFVELSDIKVRSIGYVLVCGGGSMKDSECEKIRPISEMLIQNFKTLSPNAELVAIPTHTVTKDSADGTPYRVDEQISPRFLNLVGASILAEIL